jgi:hypothetical protein
VAQIAAMVILELLGHDRQLVEGGDVVAGTARSLDEHKPVIDVTTLPPPEIKPRAPRGRRKTAAHHRGEKLVIARDDVAALPSLIRRGILFGELL